jgi:hypothetical protein
MRVSATVRSQSDKNKFCSAKLVNDRPLSALFWPYLTPASSFPLWRGMAGLVGIITVPYCRQNSATFGLVSGSYQSARVTAARKLSMTVVLGTPLKWRKLFSKQWMKHSVVCRHITSL